MRTPESDRVMEAVIAHASCVGPTKHEANWRRLEKLFEEQAARRRAATEEKAKP